jgi:energy-coupling factor transport system ATP-binding protein
MRRRPRQPLDAHELADASVSAALTFSLIAVGRVLAAGTFAQVLATLVFATLASRRRGRVSAVATLSAVLLGLLLGGINPVIQASVAGLFGWCGGVALRNRWGWLKSVGFAVVFGWPVVAGFTLLALWTFGDIRELSLENASNSWSGVSRILSSIGLGFLARRGDDLVEPAIEHWYIAAPLVQLGITVGYALIVKRVGGVIADRVTSALGPPAGGVGSFGAVQSTPETGAGNEHPQPIPLAVRNAELRHHSGAVLLSDVNLDLAPGEFVGLAGPNGVGKTTLMRGLAGIGDLPGLTRAGSAGLGHHGGTALVGQRPETQVLGMTVLDDLRWRRHEPGDKGAVTLDDATRARLAAALASVGLEGYEDRYTEDLSGGELQRLALAGALLSEPRLVLSDESTAMLDPEAREEVMGLLRSIASSGAAVVHASHHRDELDLTDRLVGLGGGKRMTTRRPDRALRTPGSLAVTVRDLSFVHSPGTPWEHRVLNKVSFEVRRSELTLVTGSNGSGKTTLALLLAGILQPTEGEIVRHGVEPGIAFQHARLQLLRSTVGAEVGSLAGMVPSDRRVAEWMTRLGLDPGELMHRRVDALSGGQQRRVLLAGLLARGSSLLILDEPLAGLDTQGADRLLDILDQVVALGTSVVVVSHDPSWGRDRADRVVQLVDGTLITLERGGRP